MTPSPISEHDRDLLDPDFATQSDGTRIAYRRRDGSAPGIVFLGGYRSNMGGDKARHLDGYAAASGRGYLRFDYSGHGQSDGEFEQGTIGRWTQDVLFALDALTDGPQVLVGSSLGGWLALLVAMARPERVAAILTVSLAADFTAHVRDVLFSDAHRAELEKQGRVLVPDCHGGEPFAITRRLIDEAEAHLLLTREALPITVPMRLIHARNDQDVPWSIGNEIADRVEGNDVRVTVVKDGDHQLSRDQDLALMSRELDDLYAVLNRR